jgi:GTP cyclohydrolase FolE2
VVEAILPHDRSGIHTSRAMSLRDDVLNEQKYYAVDFLAPYVDYIDIIGDGNMRRRCSSTTATTSSAQSVSS